ncbi:hypothetical protein BJ165DRAFT_1517611 [Panaeolus papilionaceus]|nr:hypothetical protein BJ165DRAFT_1517611 [Panaeolus papilionaceus]
MKYNLFTLFSLSLSIASLVNAVALPEAMADKRQIICTGLPLGAVCSTGNQCCGWPTNGCFGFPGSTKHCQPA